MQISKLIEIIKECGDILLRYQKDIKVEVKKDGTPVTKADKEVNQRLQDFLKKEYPTYGIMSEEDEKEHKEYTWYIDPLNGTGSYSRGEDRFNILVGLVRDNTPILGIIYHPMDDRLYIGGEDVTPKEIFKNKERLLTTPPHKKENLLFTPSENWENVFKELFRNNPEYTFVYWDGLGDEFKDPRINILDGYINLQINNHFGAWGTWDICAGDAIISQLGGGITDFYGKEIDYSKPNLDNGFIVADTRERIEKLPWLQK